MRTRRIALFALAAVAPLVATATPTAASTPIIPLHFTISPVGGTPGTSIQVNGTCGAADIGYASLGVPPASDAIEPPADYKQFTVNSNDSFNVTLNSPYGLRGGFPTDARVVVSCGVFSAEKPYQGSATSMSFSPSIYTSRGASPCGYAYVPVGTDASMPCNPHVKGFASTGALAGVNHYARFHNVGGPSIAVGDVTGDGRLDIVTGSGAGEPSNVSITSPTGDFVSTADPYGDFPGGVNVAVGDVTGDGRADIVTGAGPGGGPHVVVFSYNSATQIFDTVGSFYAYASNFAGGVNVAVGNREVVTAPGAGGGPHVRRFATNGALKSEFFAYASNFTGGVNVAADSTGRVVTGAGAGGGPHAIVFNAANASSAGFYAYEPAFAGGVEVAIGRVNGVTQIVTGPERGVPHIRIFNTDGSLKSGGFYAYANFPTGVKVAVTP